MVSREERNARARDNQRTSRARRLDYINALEEKIRHFEATGISASQEVQISARIVEKQNVLLKGWLSRATGIREGELQEWLKMPGDMASQCFNAAISQRFAHPASMSGSSRSQGNITGYGDALPTATTTQPSPSVNGKAKIPAPLPTNEFAPPLTLDVQASTAYGRQSQATRRPSVPSSAASSGWSMSLTPYSVPSQLSSTSFLPNQYRSASTSHDSYPPAAASSIRSDSYESTSALPAALSNGFIAQMPSSLYHDGQNYPLYNQAMHQPPTPQNYYSDSSAKYVTTEYHGNGNNNNTRQYSQSPQLRSQYQSHSQHAPQPSNSFAPPVSHAAETQQQQQHFPNLLGLLDTEAFDSKCGTGLGVVGQQFCTLLSLLAPSVTIRDGANGESFAAPASRDKSRELTCRESYGALQHILGDRMSVEEAVGRLMQHARLSEVVEEGSIVDVSIVRELLDSIGVEQQQQQQQQQGSQQQTRSTGGLPNGCC